MFIIIGGDGKEYGPVTVDQVRVWLNAGRANLETRAKALGTDEWRRLGDFAEFAGPGEAPPVMATPVNPIGGSVVATVVPAERGTRLAARAIDWALEFIVAIPGVSIIGPEIIKVALMMSKGETPDLSQLDLPRLALGAGLLFGAWLILLVVQVWMLTQRGQSIGKRLLKIRIVRFADHADPGIIHAWLLREVPMTAIGILMGFLPFIGPFLIRPAFHLTDWCMIFRDDQRCLHDLMAGTKVVRV